MVNLIAVLIITYIVGVVCVFIGSLDRNYSGYQAAAAGIVWPYVLYRRHLRGAGPLRGLREGFRDLKAHEDMADHHAGPKEHL